MYEIVIEV